MYAGSKAPAVYIDDLSILHSLNIQHAKRRCNPWWSVPNSNSPRKTIASTGGARVNRNDNQNKPQQQQQTTSSSSSSSSSTTRGFLKHLLVVHNIDLLDQASLSQLLMLCRKYPNVRLLASIDDPNWLTTAPTAFILATQPATVHVQDPTYAFLARHVEVSGACAASGSGGSGIPGMSMLLSDLHGVGSSGGPGQRGGGAGGSSGGAQPLADTVRRVLISLPPAFRKVIRYLLTYQRDIVGDGVPMGINHLTEYMETEYDYTITGLRMREIVKDLTANRIAVYNEHNYTFLIPQRVVLSHVLDSLEAGDGASVAGQKEWEERQKQVRDRAAAAAGGGTTS